MRLRVTAAWDHLRRWRFSETHAASRYRAALDLVPRRSQRGPLYFFKSLP